MKKVSPLRPRGTIGVIALSAPAEQSRLEYGIKKLESFGYTVKVALSPASAYGSEEFLFSSDSAENRIKGLSALLKDPKVDCIIAVRGAYGSMELLPKFPAKLLSTKPKIISGFSDTTAMHLAWFRSKVPSIHGPSLEATFSKYDLGAEHQESGDKLLSYLKGETINPLEGEPLTVVREGKGKGPIIGGNLGTLSALAGTKALPNFKDTILFIEEVGEKPYRVHRMLLQLKLAGAFNGLKGLLLGSFRDCKHAAGLGPIVEEVLCDIFRDAKFPIFSGLPCGHEARNLPLPFGVMAEIKKCSLRFLESPFRKI